VPAPDPVLVDDVIAAEDRPMLLGVENPAEGAFPGIQVSQFHRLPTSRAYEFGLVEPLIRGMAVHGGPLPRQTCRYGFAGRAGFTMILRVRGRAP